jgi:hypothetical protein
MTKPLLIVFDIDETLLHFVRKVDVPDVWDPLDEKYKSSLDYIKNNGNVIIFRPKLYELLHYLINNKIFIGLWTYSDKEYALGIKSFLINHFKLKKDAFKFVYSDADIESAIEMSSNGDFYSIDKINKDITEIDKDLRYIWYNYPKLFNKFNTILVDDKDTNILHKINNNNCIYIQPYTPILYKRTEHLKPKIIEDSINDNIVKDLIFIINKVKEDIKGLDQEEFDDAFNVEEVFTRKRVNRMGLKDFYINYKYNKKNKKVKIISVGYVNKERLSSASRSPGSKGGAKTKRSYAKSNFIIAKRNFTTKR